MASQEWLKSEKQMHFKKEHDSHREDFYFKSRGKIILKTYRDNILFYYKERDKKNGVSEEDSVKNQQRANEILDLIFNKKYVKLLASDIDMLKVVDIFYEMKTLTKEEIKMGLMFYDQYFRGIDIKRPLGFK